MGVEFDQTVYPDIDVLRYIIVYMKLYIYIYAYTYIYIYTSIIYVYVSKIVLED